MLLNRVIGPLLLAGLAGCDDPIVIEDNWGPPAGFTVVQGTVRRADGSPARGIDLFLSQCTNPLGVSVAPTATDQDGRYVLAGNLAPVGLFPRDIDPDTLRMQCNIVTVPPPLVLDTVQVRFWRNESAVVPLVVDLQLPS